MPSKLPRILVIVENGEVTRIVRTGAVEVLIKNWDKIKAGGAARYMRTSFHVPTDKRSPASIAKEANHGVEQYLLKENWHGQNKDNPTAQDRIDPGG